MDKTELKTKFENYLGDTGKNQRELDLTINTFTNKVFDMFLNWLESYRNGFSKSYKEIFFHAVVPLMRDKLDIFWNHDFKEKTYERYESLFIDFMKFASKNKEYINSIMFDWRKEKLENLVEWQYWKIFDKKSFLEAWHSRIKEDTWKNWDKHRKYLADIYWYLSNRQLNLLYEIFFNSYEICSKINGKNSEHKWKENYEKRDAFDEAFSNIKSKLYGFDWEKLSEIKSLFWKYLNFIPKYRETLIKAMDWKTEWWKNIQKGTEESLIGTLSDEELFIPDENPFYIDEDPIEYENIGWKDSEWISLWIEWDWFWPIKVVRTSRDENRGIYDQTERGDIIAPINYWIFPEINHTWDPKEEELNGNIKEKDNDEEKNSSKVESVKEKNDDPNQDELYKFDPDEENRWNR